MNINWLSIFTGRLYHRLLITFWVAIYGLIILQDYIYSVLRDTGFYWSDVTLFNSYWLLFIPFLLLENKLLPVQHWKTKGRLINSLLILVAAVVFSLLHVFTFSTLFTGISNLLFTPPHRFVNILISSVSNDLYLTLLVYFLNPFIYLKFAQKEDSTKKKAALPYPTTLSIKKGNRILSIVVADIYSLHANKPYTTMHTGLEKHLLQQSLTAMEKQLDPGIFLRVHRSAIINKTWIKEITSRQNGDYDALLQNGQSIRLSRHYRKNWAPLIPSST